MSRRRLLGAPVTIEEATNHGQVYARVTDQSGVSSWVCLHAQMVHRMYVEADTGLDDTYAHYLGDAWIERDALGAMRDALIRAGAYDLCPAVDGRAACERITEEPPYCEHHRKEA